MQPCFWRNRWHANLQVFANGFHGSHCFNHCGFRFSVLLAFGPDLEAAMSERSDLPGAPDALAFTEISKIKSALQTVLVGGCAAGVAYALAKLIS